MNIFRSRGHTDRLALARDAFAVDADADRRAGAVEIENGRVAEVFDENEAVVQQLTADGHLKLDFGFSACEPGAAAGHLEYLLLCTPGPVPRASAPARCLAR